MYRSSPVLRRRVHGDILFAPMFFLGVLAAIAIPAYQDYTTRSQVTEGLNLASAVKVAAAEYYATNSSWPATLKDLGFDKVPRGHYVAAVTMYKGTVVILYGRQATPQIARKLLTLRPTTNARHDVIWSCGYSEDVGVDPESGPAAPNTTNIELKYLPRACRGK